MGEIFSADTNAERKKAFDIRTVMRAVADQDLPTLERWAGMADADTAVVQDTYVGGHSVCMLGIESKPVRRRGFPPTDGPDTYTAGTLFPRSSTDIRFLLAEHSALCLSDRRRKTAHHRAVSPLNQKARS